MHKLMILIVFLGCIASCTNNKLQSESTWRTIETPNTPTARHEASMVEANDKLYLIGGRRVNPVDQYDPKTQRWTELSLPPIELHHFQAVTVGDVIYIVGAFTGPWPNETPVGRVIKYYPALDKFEYGHNIPASRQRGAAGAVYHKGKIYIVGGITDGHMGGYRSWLDAYDPITGEWQVLADAPHARDHFQASVINNKLYAIAGRHSSQATDQGFELTIPDVDVYDFDTGVWQTLSEQANLPTERAGNMAIAWQNQVIIAGGESGEQVAAHDEVEVFNTETLKWEAWPSLNQGRHGTGLGIINGHLYVGSGSGNRGGEPELFSIESLPIEGAKPSSASVLSTKKLHTLTLSFEGPDVSELDNFNPFTDYRLMVEFTHKNTSYLVRGFYAADGNAADSSAQYGNVWQVRFTPEQIGQWQYQARFAKGKDIAISRNYYAGETIEIPHNQGAFNVIESDAKGKDFRAHGRIEAKNGYFKFANSSHYWLKGGANSPENLLAYVDFDDTYRIGQQSRDGEASAGTEIHRYEAHADDWQTGDTLWKQTKGKNLIGAINYLANQGMNSVYFLTLNIDGDGKDVWPYLQPNDFSRFDVSKLEQWERVFSHMQQRGILLHLVTQETENERLLDDGDLGRLRKLYYAELIARFSHHLALVWNLGEENGPAHWSPVAQSDQQRIDMANYFRRSDPYQHPVLLHTHSTAIEKDQILTPLLGLESLDGLSFQVDQRERVYAETALWRERSKHSGNEWLITMDEIGMWHTGALNDAQDPAHDTLRRHALWGSILAGAAGVEWYFGGKQPHNDLTAEDWRTRHKLWQQTNVALTFFNTHIDFWSLEANPHLVDNSQVYSANTTSNKMVLYIPANESVNLNLQSQKTDFILGWFDPKQGGELTYPKQNILTAGKIHSLVAPQTKQSPRDWVALLLPHTKPD